MDDGHGDAGASSRTTDGGTSSESGVVLDVRTDAQHAANVKRESEIHVKKSFIARLKNSKDLL
jgi:hypothetical protein